MSNLSGGEKTLSSLSLIFALHHYKPSPLYVMDEIDAALDFRNVSVIADYIKDRTKDSQFIIISLRNQMFENANELIGIYKTFDITKVVIFNPNAYDVRGNPIIAKKKKEEKNENKSKSNKKLDKNDNISKSNSKSKSIINMEYKSEMKEKSISMDLEQKGSESKKNKESEKEKEKDEDKEKDESF